MLEAAKLIAAEMHRNGCSSSAAVQKIASARRKQRQPFDADTRELFDLAAIRVDMALFDRGPSFGRRRR